jgi:hypothetical protein
MRCVAIGAGGTGKSTELARRCWPPSGPFLDVIEMRREPGPPQPVPGGNDVADAAGLREAGQVARCKEEEDACLYVVYAEWGWVG